MRDATWIDVHDDPHPQDLGLDQGETAAILLAESLCAEAVLIDERRGRAVAQLRGLVVVGTLGVLAGAKRLGAVTAVGAIVAELRASGFWLADQLVRDYLAALGEKPPNG